MFCVLVPGTLLACFGRACKGAGGAAAFHVPVSKLVALALRSASGHRVTTAVLSWHAVVCLLNLA